jgi:hypothetical protein
MQILLNIISVLYIMAFAVSGFLLARLFLPRDRFVKQLMFGMALGLVMLLWLPVILAFIIDFTLLAQLISLAIAIGAGVFALIRGRGRAKTGSFHLKEERALLLTCIPLIFIGAVLMGNHYITNASDGSLHVGQCTYGDLCMHLGFITSISVQKSFPPMYSILPGTQLGYPFLCDSVSSTFYTLGSSLRMATILPALYAYITVVLAVYLFFEDWFRRNSVAVLATWLFFVGGGFGFAYFFDNAKTFASLTSPEAWQNWFNEVFGISTSVNGAHALDMGERLLEGWYKTPTNYVDLGLRWVNSIADMLIPQRATLFGWALLFPSLQLLRRAVFDRENKLFLLLGVTAGAMPLVHTHSFFALGLISIFLIIARLFPLMLSDKKAEEKKPMKENLKYFFLFGVIAVVLAAPQLLGFTFRQSSAGGFLKFHLNWCNESDSWLWFYIKNLGFIFILMPAAFLCTKKDSRLFYGGGLLIWALCEFVVFQPNTYDNNKLLFVWFALTCGIVAELIMNVWKKLISPDRDEKGREKKKPLGVKIACTGALCVLIASMLLSGVMTLAREYVSGDHLGTEDGKLKYRENGYQVVSASLVDITEWINENVEPDATLLTATNHNNAVAMLTGRNIVCGSPTFLHFHGVDYSERYYNVELIYEQPAEYFERYAQEYGIDYVLVGEWERGSYYVDTAYFERLTPVYSAGSNVLYKVEK